MQVGCYLGTRPANKEVRECRRRGKHGSEDVCSGVRIEASQASYLVLADSDIF